MNTDSCEYCGFDVVRLERERDEACAKAGRLQDSILAALDNLENVKGSAAWTTAEAVLRKALEE